MKALKLLALIMLFYCTASAQASKPDYSFLNNYNGRYAYDVQLLDNRDIKHTLILLLGHARFAFFKANWNVENPITVKNGIFTATACQQHNCSDVNFIIVINIAESKVYAGIRENGKAKIYPPGNSSPRELINWLND